MKDSLLKFLVSRLGGLLTPFIALGVGVAIAKLAAFDPNLASSLDKTAVTGFVVTLIVSLVNYATNAAQVDGIKSIQAVANVPVDGVFGPVTYTEVRKAFPKYL
jgi:peptidoglycan hydrolase-like protein with peptidoglycan-binding domain